MFYSFVYVHSYLFYHYVCLFVLLIHSCFFVSKVDFRGSRVIVQSVLPLTQNSLVFGSSDAAANVKQIGKERKQQKHE